MKIEELEGLFAINHYRRIEIGKRDDSLTDKAKQFLKYTNAKFIETPYLYKLIKKVIDNEISKEKVREVVVKGQEIK